MSVGRLRSIMETATGNGSKQRQGATSHGREHVKHAAYIKQRTVLRGIESLCVYFRMICATVHYDGAKI